MFSRMSLLKHRSLNSRQQFYSISCSSKTGCLLRCRIARTSQIANRSLNKSMDPYGNYFLRGWALTKLAMTNTSSNIVSVGTVGVATIVAIVGNVIVAPTFWPSEGKFFLGTIQPTSLSWTWSCRILWLVCCFALRNFYGDSSVHGCLGPPFVKSSLSSKSQRPVQP